MELTDLEEGDSVVLEIKWGEHPYQISTAVVGAKDGALLVSPFKYKGTVLDLGSVHFRNMFFNLYGMDKKADTRLVWRNVQIEAKMHKNEMLYAVRTSSSRKFPAVSDRRQNKRMLLDIRAKVISAEDGRGIPVVLHDVSDSGLSFYAKKGLQFTDKTIRLEFEDTVHDHSFHLAIDSRFVRRVEKDTQDLIGCQILKSDRNFLSYVCLKKMQTAAENKFSKAVSEAKHAKEMQKEDEQKEENQDLTRQNTESEESMV